MRNASHQFRNDRLIQRRKELGILQIELARECGVTNIQMHRIEKGERGVTVDMLVKLTQQLECSADWLLGLGD